MAHPVQVRFATADDLEALLVLERACFDDPWQIPSLTAELPVGPPSADHHRAWVALDQGAVVGSLLAWRLFETCEINRVATLPACRGRGIGKAMVQACLGFCEAEGASQALLEVRADNAAAIALYRSCGFDATGLRKRYYADGSDALIMTQALQPPI